MRTPAIISLVFCATLQAAPARLLRPILFEPGTETGQYLAHASRGSLRLTSAGVEFAGKDKPVIRLALVGAKSAQPVGDELMRSTSTYFLGNDPNSWRTRVANYGKVRYSSVYPGVDLVFRGAESAFEYDFLIAPYADPSRIRMRFDGASEITLTGEGDLLIDGWFTQRRPRIYQELAQGTRETGGRFRVHGDHTVSFETGAYDHSRPLVIDPVITYTSYLGGTGIDVGAAITTDKDGNVYVGGATVANNFPGTDTFGQRPAIRQTGYVTKFAPIVGGATQQLFTIFLGDNATLGASEVNGLAIDSSGNIIAVGNTNGGLFPTKNAVQAQLSGGMDCQIQGDASHNEQKTFCSDGFLTKIGPDGATLIFSTYYGGKLENDFTAVALDSADHIYVAGKAFGPTDLAGTLTAIQPHPTNTTNMQVVSFDPTGKVLYSTYLGGTVGQAANSIAVEKPGVVWIGGISASTDMPTTANGYLTKYTGIIESVYFARIDTTKSGKAGLTYGSFFNGPSGNSSLSHLFLDPSGQVVFCGSAFSVLPTTPTAMQANGFGAPQADVNGSLVDADAFIARINPALSGASQLTYGSYISGTDEEAATGCGLDPQGNFVVSGWSLSVDPFLTIGSTLPLKGVGTNPTIFVIRIDPTKAGGRLESLLFGGESYDVPQAMAIDTKGFAYLVGNTLSKVFPVSANAVQKTAGSNDGTLLNGACCGDTFVMQLDLNRMQAGVTQLALDSGDFQAGPAGSVLPNALVVHLADSAGNALALAGYTVAFTATNGVTLVTPAQGVTDGTGVTGVRVKLGSSNGTVTASLVGAASPITYTFHVTVGSGTGTPGCTYTLSPTSLHPIAAGGDSTLSIQTGAGCAWSVTALPSWITVSGASSGNGPANLTLVVAANTGAARTGTISVSGASATVTQAAPGCTYSLSAGGQAFPASGGNGSVTVTVQAGCAWTVSGAPSWVTVKSGSAGSGNGTLTYQVGANTGADRSVTLTIASLTFSIEQVSPSLAGSSVAGSMAQIASAGGWKMTITLINTGTSAAKIRLNFFNDAGSALVLPLTFPQGGITQAPAAQPNLKLAAAAIPSGLALLASTLDRTLNGGASLIIETTGPDSQATQVGWAQLLSTGSVNGFATFTINASHQEAVVPLEIRTASSYRLAFDNTGGLLTGLAIANLSAQAATIPLIIRDDSGAQIGNPLLNLPAHGHTSFMLTQNYAITANKRGSVEFDAPAGGQISVLGLRAHAPALTTLPLLANVTAGGGSMAHVASAGGWQTTFTFVNTGTSAAQITLSFTGDDGSALSLPLSFPQTSTSATASSVTKTLAPNASLVIQTQGSSAQAVVTGSAHLATTGSVGGFAIFRDDGTGQEAVVPLETRTGNFILAFDNTNGLATGLALDNIAGQATSVPVVLRNDTGVVIGTPVISIVGQGHKSFLLAPTYPSTAGKRGTVEFDTPLAGKISALGLRATPNGTLTTIPVLQK